MPQFNIRSAVADDALGIAKVHYRSWQDTYRGIVHDAYLDSLSIEQNYVRWQKILSPGIQRGFTDVMLNEKNEVIAFVSGGKNPNESLKTEGEIMALYMLKEYHGLGHGRRLFIDGAEKLMASGNSSFCVFVLTQNPAFHFYKKFNPDTSVIKHIDLHGRQYEETGFGWKNFDIADF